MRAVSSPGFATASRAQRAGIPCSVCGELAGNPIAVPILIGMGIRELSMTPFSVTLVRQVVRAIESEKARDLARTAERCARADEVREQLTAFFDDAGLLGDPDFGPVVRRLLQPRGGRLGSLA